jgi:hypothetical protein
MFSCDRAGDADGGARGDEPPPVRQHMRTMSCERAPSATRTPISPKRCVTAQLSTP